MSGVEELVSVIRKEGAHDNLPGIQLAEVQEGGSLLINNLELDPEEDCMLPVGMTLAAGDLLAVYQYSDDCYIVLNKIKRG